MPVGRSDGGSVEGQLEFQLEGQDRYNMFCSSM